MMFVVTLVMAKGTQNYSKGETPDEGRLSITRTSFFMYNISGSVGFYQLHMKYWYTFNPEYKSEKDKTF